MATDPKAIEELVAGFSGRVLTPDAPGYEEARHVHNGTVDKRPAIIAQCRGVADVQDAVLLQPRRVLRSR